MTDVCERQEFVECEEVTNAVAQLLGGRSTGVGNEADLRNSWRAAVPKQCTLNEVPKSARR
jgi:hypothetical protein